MKKINFNSNWIFNEDRTVTLPHDFSIEKGINKDSLTNTAGAFHDTGDAVYKKHFTADESWKNKSIMVEFDGVYFNSSVYINEQLVEQHPYGYTGFVCDLTPFLLYGDDVQNELRVDINGNMMPNSRWYSGCGIYRNVTLHIGEALAIAPWDVSITTPNIELFSYEKGNAEVCADITITAYPWLLNCGEFASKDELIASMLKNTILHANIKDGEGNQVTVQTVDIAANAVPAIEYLPKPEFAESDDYRFRAHKVTVPVKFSLDNATLWSVENPYLYSLECFIETPQITTETKSTSFGVRKIEFSAAEGFKLNGKVRKIKGGCVHHDCGFLGSAAYERAEERKIELLKASGYDGLRCAHNPPSTALLDACDRLGMLVMDEAFDCWYQGKNKYDYGMFFHEHWRRDLASMILRDRNHPSVIMWSIGNEINERNGKNFGYKTAKALADYTRKIDSSRPVTSALCAFWEDAYSQKLIAQKAKDKTNNAFAWNGIDRYADTEEKFEEIETTYNAGDVRWGDLTEPYADALDVVGYNYLNWRYKADHLRWPERILMGTETFPMKAFETWEDTVNNDFVIGDFVWTSLDYLGEAGIGHVWYGVDNYGGGFMGLYPWNQAYCGDIDVCGFKRPQSYYRDCLWGVADKPYIAVYRPQRYDVLDDPTNDVSPWGWHDVFPCWSWDGFEGKPIRVEVYSTDDEVELFINGESCGRVACGKENEYIAVFNTVYNPGEVKAVTYKDGQPVNEHSLMTPKAAANLCLTPDRNEISHVIEDGDISFIKVELVDADGNSVSHSHDNVSYTVEGAGKLIAVGSGNPKTDEGYVGNCRRLDFGKGMIAIRPATGTKAGDTITIEATTADGIKGKCVVTLK